jgi:hypothetical protein
MYLEPIFYFRLLIFLFFVTVLTFLFYDLSGQKTLLTKDNLEAINVNLEETVYKGKNAMRVTGSTEGEQIAVLKNLAFENGTIEVNVSGQPLPGTDPSYRGFIGIAFRVQKSDSIRYECFYLRPTNGRAEDQLRRNHSTQYISHPRYTWYKLRKENPGMFESYTDIVAGEWTKIKIVVKGKDARFYVNGAEQPCLIVPDLKHDPIKGSIALWIGLGTDGYFTDLQVTKN